MLKKMICVVAFSAFFATVALSSRDAQAHLFGRAYGPVPVVYVQPQPVYVVPQPVYVGRPVVVRPYYVAPRVVRRPVYVW